MHRTTVIAMLIAAGVSALIGWFLASSLGKVSALRKPPPSDCRGRNCDVNIMFDCSTSPCVPYADPEVILTKSDHQTPHRIDFQIVQPTSSSHFVFDSNGIKFTSSDPVVSSLPPCHPQDSQDKFRCELDKDTPAALYKYSFRVVGLTPVDPWVVNY